MYNAVMLKKAWGAVEERKLEEKIIDIISEEVCTNLRCCYIYTHRRFVFQISLIHNSESFREERVNYFSTICNI